MPMIMDHTGHFREFMGGEADILCYCHWINPEFRPCAVATNVYVQGFTRVALVGEKEELATLPAENLGHVFVSLVPVTAILSWRLRIQKFMGQRYR